MRTQLRRFRGMIRMGLAWSVIWAPLGALFGVGWLYWDSRSPFVFTRPINFLTAAGFMGLAWAIWGFITGSLFTALLGIAEQRQSVDTIRMRRAIAWGGLAGAFLPMISGGAILIGTVATVVPGAALGGACAVATLALARTSVAQNAGKLNT
jgi:hypothetical protein